MNQWHTSSFLDFALFIKVWVNEADPFIKQGGGQVVPPAGKPILWVKSLLNLALHCGLIIGPVESQ
jgi:hypothetical protein